MTWPFHPLSRAGYGVIMADPAWRFVTWSETRQYKAPSRHYAVMGLEQIKSLPVAELAAPDCLLWLWAIPREATVRAVRPIQSARLGSVGV